MLAIEVLTIRTSAGLIGGIFALALAIFVADLMVPLGVAVWVLYLGPVVLANFGWRPAMPIYVALLSTILLVLGYLLSGSDGSIEATYSPINRTFGIITIWSVAIIGRNFIASRLALKIEDWFKAAETGLSEKLVGEQTLKQLGENVLGFLAPYSGAVVGAIYLTDGSGSYELFGTHALDRESGVRESFGPGDGLIGQAIRDQKLHHVKEVPEGYLDVRSGLGHHKPKEIVIAPAAVDGRVLGVLELGFLSEVDSKVLTLLPRLSALVGSAVRAVNFSTRQRELLEETQRQAEKLQAQQEELRVQNEELEQQSRALIHSQTQLENQQAELEQINAQLEEQTQSLEKQRDQLAHAQADLLRASAYKSEFLANMSHELRTPLNSSLILAKLLADNREGNLTEEQIKYASTIYSAGNDLLTLINDILDLSKIEAGKLDIRPEHVSIARITDELTTTFGPVAKEKGLELSIDTRDAPPSLFTDPTRLQQILKNLISNALKFTERGGVTLRVERQPDRTLRFSVTDTGIGIPPEQQEAIFEAFRQADGTVSRRYGGTGLGLSISRDLSRLLGGSLGVESTPGHGSSFWITLPEQYAGSAGAKAQAQKRKAQPSSPARPPAAPPQRAADGAELPSRPKEAPAPEERSRPRGNRTILIIEDDLAFAEILRDLARELDFDSLMAHSGEDGLALANRYQPSAIILDVQLPDRSGLSVLDALKHNPATRHIPVHMASVSDHTQTALEMGAAGYALKPVARDELLAAFERLESKFSERNRRILVIEDDQTHRESTCQLLAADNVEVVPSASAAEALELLSSTTFDCVVMDLNLPDRTGFELLDEISNKEEYSVPPVIVYTGRSLSREEEQRLRRFSSSIIIKGARSPERLLDEVTLFLHQVESSLPPDRQRMLRAARNREAVFEGRRILVVEDDVRNIFAVTSIFEPKGAKIEIARNGREALELLERDPNVDLVLMDIMMPEMDGLEATREIRRRPELAKLPIIALTAKAMSDDRDSCLEAGANDYMAKPLDVDRLLSLARVWIRK